MKHYVVVTPLYVVFNVWRRRQAETTRLITWSELQQEQTPPPVAPVQDDGVGMWLGYALALAGALTAGWFTKSLDVYLAVFIGIGLLLFAGSRLAAWLRRRDGVMA